MGRAAAANSRDMLPCGAPLARTPSPAVPRESLYIPARPSLSDRVQQLIQTLQLVPHPEGGLFREVFRSPQRVSTRYGLDRSALTSIYFLLAAGQKSRWHRVAHDESWHFYEGDPIELLIVSPDLATVERRMLGPAANGTTPVAIVPAGCWQAARCSGRYALAGCTVGPGYEGADFALMNDHADAARMRERHPELAALL